MVHITIFLQVSKVFAIFIKQTWKWSALLQTSRYQTFSFPICLPTAHQKQGLCVHTGQWFYKRHILPWQGSPRKSIHRQVQWTRATAQVTTWTNRATVWLSGHANPKKNDSSANLLWTSYTHHGMACGLPCNSLPQKQRRIMERTPKLPATNTPEC